MERAPYDMLQLHCLSLILHYPEVLRLAAVDESLFTDEYRVIYNAMEEMADSGSINEVLLATKLENKLQSPITWVTLIDTEIVDRNDYTHFFGELKKRKAKASLVEILENTRKKVLHQGEDVHQVVEGVVGDLQAMMIHLTDDSTFSHEPAAVKSLFVGEGKGIFGIGSLDSFFSRLGTGKLIIVGGRPGSGKSTLLIQAAYHHAVSLNEKVCVFSLEMSESEYAQKLASLGTGEAVSAIESGSANSILVEASLKRVYENLWISDSPEDISPLGICSKIERLHNKVGLSLVIIDYLQIMSTESVANRKYVIGAYSRALSKLAKSLGINVLVASQLNRASDVLGREPELADIAESDNPGQDAHVVILVYPYGTWGRGSFQRGSRLGKDGKLSNASTLKVAKYRGGRTGEVVVLDDFARSRFTEE